MIVIFNRNSKLWIVIWICGLCFVAGYLNAVTLLSFQLASSHVTGHTSQLAIQWLRGDNALALNIFFIMLSYVIGASVSGFIHPENKMIIEPSYSYLLLFLMFLMGIAQLTSTTVLAVYIAAFGLGIQNALFITVRGVVIRTTHMTGVLSDIGSTFGAYLRGQRHLDWKIILLAGCLLSFFLGSISGVLLYPKIKQVYILAGLFYFILYLLTLKLRKQKIKRLN